VAVHQPNLRLFADSDSRAQYGYRLITGAYTSSLWRMTFGYAPPIEWDARIKGRGAVGIGEAPSLIHHAQITWMPAAERRRVRHSLWRRDSMECGEKKLQPWDHQRRQ